MMDHLAGVSELMKWSDHPFSSAQGRGKSLLHSVVAGFTLIEMLVATTILVIIVGILFTITQQTSKVWKNTTGKTEVFLARATGFWGFMTRTISQATLNTYYDYACGKRRWAHRLYLHRLTARSPPCLTNHYARRSDLQNCRRAALPVTGGN